MTRFSSLVTSLFLAVSLVLAASGGGYLITAHAPRSAGQQTIVICGAMGAEILAQDHNGDPADNCAVCADHGLAAAGLLMVSQCLASPFEFTAFAAALRSAGTHPGQTPKPRSFVPLPHIGA